MNMYMNVNTPPHPTPNPTLWDGMRSVCINVWDLTETNRKWSSHP